MRIVYHKCPLKVGSHNIRNFINNKFIDLEPHNKTPIAIIMIGGPGSGKSSIKKEYIQKLGYSEKNFVTIDPDEIIHSLFSENYNCKKEMKKTLQKTFDKAWSEKYNIIIDKKGKNFNKTYDDYIIFLKKQGYRVFLCLTILDYPTATTRILQRNRGYDNSRQLQVAKKTYRELKKNYSKYVDLECNEVDGIFVYDNQQKLTLVYKSSCNSKGEKYFECYSTTKLTRFLEKKCSQKNKKNNKKKYTRKKRKKIR